MGFEDITKLILELTGKGCELALEYQQTKHMTPAQRFLWTIENDFHKNMSPEQHIIEFFIKGATPLMRNSFIDHAFREPVEPIAHP